MNGVLSSFDRTTRLWSRFGKGLCLLFVASVVGICLLLIVIGPRLRAALDAEDERVTEAENRAFCSKFGIGPETNRYTDCAAGLNEIRTKFEQRKAETFF